MQSSAPLTPGAPAWDGAPLPATRLTRVVDLNLVKLRVSTNLEQFAAFEHFARFAPPEAEADYHLHCTDLDRDAMDEASLARAADRTQRAQRFCKGYYRGPYFGPPAYLVTRGREFRVYGRSLQKLVWPYFVKHVLTVHAADLDAVHLKAAGFALEGRATLLVGLGGGGKTVFLAQACLHGARFLANTHVIVDEGIAHGVPSSMRIRNDDCFGPLIRLRGLQRHLDQDEYVVSPDALWAQESLRSAPVGNIVVVDFKAQGSRAMRRISSVECLSFLDQFALGVTTYGLKDDLFLHFGGDLQAYAAHYAGMKQQLAQLCDTARCYHATLDMMQADERDAALRELARP